MSAWQPIETAPRDGQFIVLYDARYLHTPDSYLIAKFHHGMWWGQKLPSGKSRLWREATHWQPLPEPPK